MRLLRTTGTLLSAAAAVLAASGCSFLTGVRGTSRVSVSVSPDVINVSQTAQAIGTAYDGDTPLGGNNRYVVSYTSRDPNVATVAEATGLVTGKAYGTTYIVAENRGKRDSAQITVRPFQAVQLFINGPKAPTYRVGAPNGLSATAVDSAGRVIGDRPTTWVSRDPKVLTVSAVGAVTPLAVGTTWVVASITNGPGKDPRADSVLATVTLPPVVSVVITPNNSNNNTPTVYVGQTLQFSATLVDSLNNTATRPVTWSANDNGRTLTVSAAGLATGVSPNGANLTAFTPTYLTATVDVVPNQPTPRTTGATVAVAVFTAVDSTRVFSGGREVTTLTVAKSSNTTISFLTVDAFNGTLTGRIVSLTSSNPAVASVPATSSTGNGVITAGGTAGTATITVQALDTSGNGQGKKSTLTVTVP